MQVRVLGSSAGGGSPQWNCHCSVCRAVRSGAPGTRRRMQSSLAVRAAPAEPWLLVNASPDVARQLELLDVPVHDDVVRDVPFGAVLVTDAEIDHCAGLLLLREGDAPLTLYATAAARGAAVMRARITATGSPGRARWQRAARPGSATRDDSQRAKSSFIPPAMSTDTSMRILGSATPPGATRYRGSHTGSNFALYRRNPSKL